MKRLSIIGIVGLPARYGGFETLADNIVKYLSNKYSITVFCSSSKQYNNRDKIYSSAKRFFIPLKANGPQSFFYDIVSILISLFIADTLLILGVSGCLILPIIKLFHHKKIIVATDGFEWKRDKWSQPTKWFLKFSERCAAKYADTIITDNKIMQEYIKSQYNKSSELIEYGADHSLHIKPTIIDLIEYSFLTTQYALAISRIEPENNCDLILNSFSEFNDLKLVYVGNWRHNKYSRNLKRTYSSNKNIIFLDAIYDIYKLNLIRSNCTIYIHGHSVGGTNPALVEAMNVGIPIIAYNVNFNLETTNKEAIYFTDKFQLIDSIILYLRNVDFMINIGRRMKCIADERYKWIKIIEKYNAII